MASRYYNPSLAQKVGAASAEQYVSITPAIEKGQMAFERQQAKQLKQQELRFEKRKLEAEAFKKALEQRDDVLYAVQKNMAKTSKKIDFAPPAIKNRVIAMGDIAKQNYKQLQDAIKQGRLNRGAALMWQDENVNKYIDDAASLLDKYPEIISNYANSQPSMINSSKDINITNKIAKGEFELDAENNAIIKSEDGKTIEAKIPFDELANPTYIPVDTEAFTAAFTTVNAAADKAASKGKSLDSFNKDIDAAISSLNFTPEQALSIAFDYLGKEMPEFVTISDFKDKNGNIDIAKFKGSIDMDNGGKGDGVPGEPEDLNLWVKSQLKKAATESYEDYRRDYADKFDTGTEADKKRQRNKEIADQTITSIISDPIKAIEKSGMPDKTEVKNNKITFYNLDKDNNKVINSQFDLKTKEGIAALAKYIASYDYKNDVDLIYNINNYPLTDEQLNQIQKAFLPSLLPRYN